MQPRFRLNQGRHTSALRATLGLTAALSVALAACAPTPPPAPTAAPKPTEAAKPAAPAAPAPAPAPAASPAAAAAPAASPAAAAPAAAPAASPAAQPAAKPVANLPALKVAGGSQTTWTTHIPVLVGIHQGFFKEAGFPDVEWTKAGNDTNSLAALVSGKVDISTAIPADITAKLVQKGEKIYIIGAHANKLNQVILGQKGLSSMADLKGKKIATDESAATVDGYIEKALKPHNMTLKDVTLVRLGSTSERYKALENGVVEAAIIGVTEQARALDSGFVKLFDMGTLFDEYLQRTYVVGGKFFDEHPASVDAFMKVMVRAHDWLYNPANYDRLWEITQAEKYQIDEKYFKTIVTDHVKTMPRNAAPSAKGLQIVLDEVKDEAPNVTADSLLRLGPVQKGIQETGVKPN